MISPFCQNFLAPDLETPPIRRRTPIDDAFAAGFALHLGDAATGAQRGTVMAQTPARFPRAPCPGLRGLGNSACKTGGWRRAKGTCGKPVPGRTGARHTPPLRKTCSNLHIAIRKWVVLYTKFSLWIQFFANPQFPVLKSTGRAWKQPLAPKQAQAQRGGAQGLVRPLGTSRASRPRVGSGGSGPARSASAPRQACGLQSCPLAPQARGSICLNYEMVSLRDNRFQSRWNNPRPCRRK